MFIDTHAHINFNDFKQDGDEVIRRSLSEKVWMVIVGSDYKTSKRALDYSNKYERGVYASVGLHPLHLCSKDIKGDDYGFKTNCEIYNYENYEKLAKFEKVVAIGEIGLDYYHIDPRDDVMAIKENQKNIFLSQLLMALKLNLPVIIHCRQAHDDILKILTEFKNENKKNLPKDKRWGVMHCFSGNEDLAWKYFNLGLLISFTGLITFSRQWDDLIRKLPLDKFMIETDCPYMTPEPFRGERNEPVLVKYVAKKIAEIKKIDIEKIEEASTENARKFFNI